MRWPNSITILSLVFLFAMSGSMVQGAAPGAQLEFIAAEANLANGDWANSGEAGKKLKGGLKLGRDTPVFEAAAGDEPARLTAQVKNQYFGGNFAINPSVKVKDWTLEVILKRNGPAFGVDHHVLGLHKAPHSGNWQSTPYWIMLGFMDKDTGKMWIELKGNEEINYDPVLERKAYENVVDIGVNKWHHILFAYDSKKGELEPWIQGRAKKKVRAKHDFDEETELNYHVIFAGAAQSQIQVDREQTFNGSIQLVRLYNRLLTGAEIQENLSVEAADKLATSWGFIKTQY